MSRMKDELERLDNAVGQLEAAVQRRIERVNGDLEAIRKAAVTQDGVPSDVVDHAVLSSRVDKAIKRLEIVLESEEG